MPRRQQLSSGLALNRRDCLRAGLLTAWGLTLSDWLRMRAVGQEATAESGRPPAKGCILIWLAGGASHVDTFDPKPDAPADTRGEFKPIDTSVAGVRISEILPKLAQQMHKLAIIRTLTSPEADHDRAAHHVLTGYRPSPAVVYPGYGSVMAKLRSGQTAAAASTLPPSAIPQAPLFASSGYLTPAFDPFVVGADPNATGFRVRDLTPPDRLTLERLERRRRMMNRLDSFAAELPTTGLVDSRDQFIGRAYDLLTSRDAQDAFNLERESAEARDRYGRTTLGQSCLLARRLIEAGVGFVTVNDQGSGPLGWDTHQQNFASLKDRLAPPLDQAVSALIGDLEERGMLEETLVVVMGEFGRTPLINPNAGRDHHPRANSLLMAGAGVAQGLVIGRTDDRADSPIERPVTPSDLAATVFQALGVNLSTRFQTGDGQPIRLVDNGQPVAELFA